MGQNNFRLPPVSPLIGSSLRNFNNIIYGKNIDPRFRFKVFLSRMIVLILSPLRFYEEIVFSLKKVKNKEEINPLFILGHWRSGTTYLHNILCQDPDTAFVSTYQTVFTNYLASQRLLKPVMRWIMPSNRPGDNVKLAVDFPQEEEFAISNTAEQSFYNFFYFPKHVGDYYHKYVRFESSEEDKKIFADKYLKILQRALINKSPASKLVIKNPVNTARLGFLSSYFPNATFIHIYRNPYVVYLSTKRFFSELLPTLWFQQISQQQITEMIVDLYLNIYDDYFSYIEKNPDLKVLEIKFEEFELDPLPYIEKVYNVYFEKDIDAVKSKFIAYIESQKTHNMNSYIISRIEYEMISAKWSKYINLWGYKLPSNVKIV